MEVTAILFERELRTLIKELNSFSNEALIWQISPGVSNSAGNLTLHITGNLNHFIGAILGNTGYVRDRDAEFNSKDIPLEILISDIEKTIVVIKNVLPTLTQEVLEKDFPLLINDTKHRTDFFIQHLLLHLSYHLGQVNYLRRIISNNF